MTKAMRISRKIGMVLALVSFVLGFFPVLRFEDKGVQNVIELIQNESFMNMPAALGKVYVIICLLTMLLSLVNFIFWYYKKNGGALTFIIMNLIMLGLIIVFPMSVFYMAELPGIYLSGLPWTGWLLLRLVVGGLEIINKSSGEEFAEVFLKKK